MSYVFSVRGWLELSWPDAEIEGVAETAEEHAAKVQKIRALLTCPLTYEETLDETKPAADRYRAGWGFPQSDLDGVEYVFYGGDVEELPAVMRQIREVLAVDPFADGYFAVEGEDGEVCYQWLILGGRIFQREERFPNFDAEEPPEGYRPLPTPR